MHTRRDKKKLLARIRRIKGQSEALEKALEMEGDCINILQQIAAIRGAINGLMIEVLEGHITEHLGNNTISQQHKQDEIAQITSVIRSYLK